MKQLYTALLAMAVTAGIGFFFGLQTASEDTPELFTQYPTLTQTALTSVRHARYRLAEKDGRLAVYLQGQDEPEIVFDVYLHHLPDVDRARLEEGIEVSDYETLLALLEDYTS
jgi:hypothetical protein